MGGAPCLDCQDRFIGCHSVCKPYKKWRADKDEENEKIKKLKLAEQSAGVSAKHMDMSKRPK